MAGDLKCDAEMNKEQQEKEKKWQIEDDVRTLERAEEIKGDKERYNDAMKMMKEKIKDLNKMVGGS